MPASWCEVSGEGAGELPGDETHLVARAMAAAFELLGEKPDGAAAALRERHSAGARAGVVVGGDRRRHSRGAGADRRRRRRSSTTRRRWPWRASWRGIPTTWRPACSAGSRSPTRRTASAGRSGSRRRRRSCRWSYVPAERGLTAHARAALPRDVPHADAAFNAGARGAARARADSRSRTVTFRNRGPAAPAVPRARKCRQSADLVADLRSGGHSGRGQRGRPDGAGAAA